MVQTGNTASKQLLDACGVSYEQLELDNPIVLGEYLFLL